MKSGYTDINANFELIADGGARTLSPDADASDETWQIATMQQELARYKRLEEGWRLALDASNQGAWSLDVPNSDFYFCSGWRRMRGISETETLDLSIETWITSVHPDDRSHVLAAIEKQNSGCMSFSIIQYRERHRNGHWIWIESRSSILEWSASGQAARVVGTDADITDRKVAEQALEDLSRSLSLAIEVAGIGLFEANLKTGEVRCDRRLLDMYGMDADTPAIDSSDLLHRERLHPEDHDACLQRIATGIASGKTFENQFRIITPTGDIRHLRSRSVAFTDNEGRHKLLGVNWDVTSDMDTQASLRTSIAEAEARSAALEQARETIRQLAVHDELTGLLNRRGLNEYLRAWQAGKISFSAVLHLDLDGFKVINDEFGHHAGDLVLEAAADRIRLQLIEKDILARWGGDEFVILCANERNPAAVLALADTIVSELARPVVLESRQRTIGISIGIAKCAAGHTPGQILQSADEALYRAKANGKGRVEVALADQQNSCISTHCKNKDDIDVRQKNKAVWSSRFPRRRLK